MQLAYHTGSANDSHLDLMEICGGSAGVSRLAIRRRLRVGQNMDINAGVDLLKADEVRELYRYVSRCKPLVVAMASSCGGLGAIWTS